MAELYITIGSQFGSGGREIGKKVAEALGIPYYDKELLAVAAKESGLSHEFLQSYDEKPTNSFLYSLVMGQHHLTPGVPGNTVELSKTEQKLLRILTENAGITLSRSRLIDYVWALDADFVDENALSVSVKRLRDKLEAQNAIETVYGIWYRWKA